MKFFKYLFITLTSLVLIIVGVVGYTFAKGYIEQPVYPTDEYGSLDKQPIVSVMRQSDGGTTVKIINKTGSTLKYNGYEATHPLLRHEVRKGDKWIEENWDWCGTGISHYSISNNESAEFHFVGRATFKPLSDLIIDYDPAIYENNTSHEKNPIRVSIMLVDTKNKKYGVIKLYEN